MQALCEGNMLDPQDTQDRAMGAISETEGAKEVFIGEEDGVEIEDLFGDWPEDITKKANDRWADIDKTDDDCEGAKDETNEKEKAEDKHFLADEEAEEMDKQKANQEDWYGYGRWKKRNWR